MLGLIAFMNHHYKIKSNRESGDGRYDICLFPKTSKHPGVFMEFKWGRNLDHDPLDALAREALHQMDHKRCAFLYIHEPTLSKYPHKKHCSDRYSAHHSLQKEKGGLFFCYYTENEILFSIHCHAVCPTVSNKMFLLTVSDLSSINVTQPVI